MSNAKILIEESLTGKIKHRASAWPFSKTPIPMVQVKQTYYKNSPLPANCRGIEKVDKYRNESLYMGVTFIWRDAKFEDLTRIL